jgi:cobalt-zinc-cadmium efflux system outer membrane protein
VFVLSGLAAAELGCASTSAQPAFRDVAHDIQAKTGQKISWSADTPEDADAARAVKNLLAHELSVDGAVQIALLNNRTLQATFEELSLTQADLVQAGLLKNPTFTGRITTSEWDVLEPNIVGGVTQDFLDIAMMPARKKIAASQLEGAKKRVADAVLDLAAQVRAGFYVVQGAQQIVSMRRMIAEGSQASLDLSTRQHEAGNISDLTRATDRATFEQAKLDLVRSEADVVAARERLTTLMGTWGKEAEWKVSDRLADVPKQEIPLERLESLAVSQRQDLAALRQEVWTLSYAASLARSTRWTPGVTVGADVARLRDAAASSGTPRIGRVAVAPSVALELPIFDQKRAVIARLDAEQRMSERRLEARAIEIRSEVRAVRNRVTVARQLAEYYRTVLIPLRESVVTLSEQEYEAMLLGVYQLLLAKQSEISAYREYIETVRDYWIARSDLERAVGVRLALPGSPAAASSGAPTKVPGPAPNTTPDPGMPGMHHHHGS